MPQLLHGRLHVVSLAFAADPALRQPLVRPHPLMINAGAPGGRRFSSRSDASGGAGERT